MPAGTRCTDEAYYAEDETHLNEHKVRVSVKTGTRVEWVEEASYFFKLSAYQNKLLEPYKRPNFVLPKERLNEVASFVRERSAGPVNFAHHLRLGHPCAG